MVVYDALYYPSISSRIQTYAEDLSAERHPVIVATYSGAPEPLRWELQNLWQSDDSLAGTALIGALPYALYEAGESDGHHTHFLSGESGDTFNSVRHDKCQGAQRIVRTGGTAVSSQVIVRMRGRLGRRLSARRAREREGPVRIGPGVFRCASATPLRWPAR